MARGFKGGAGNFKHLVKQAQKLQEDLKKKQSDLESFTAEGQSGGGAVVVVANGKYQIEKVTIAPELMTPTEKDMLEDLIMTACNQAIEKVQVHAQEEMSKATGGAPIPGLF